MFKYEFVSGSNYVNQKSLNEMCSLLDAGKRIQVGINCIGHGLNNALQEDYRKLIEEKYGDRLKVTLSEGVCSYSYFYELIKE